MNFKMIFGQMRKEKTHLLDGRLGLGEAFFGRSYWFKKINRGQVSTDQLGKNSGTQKTMESSMSVEKKETLNALEKYVISKTDQKNDDEKIISFKGGEIKLRPLDGKLGLLKLPYTSSSISLASEYCELLGKDHLKNKINYLFLGEKENETSDLLGKMIQAMKINPNDYIRCPFENSDQLSGEFKNIMGILFAFKPSLIIALGAVSTNILLGKKERLSRVHGKIFKRKIQFENNVEMTVQIMPLFHPDYLNINPNMKRAAWTDLQKAMAFLGQV